MKFDKVYNEKINIFEMEEFIFPSEEKQIVKLGDTIALVTKNMDDIEVEIKKVAKAGNTVKADQLEKSIDDHKAKLEKLIKAQDEAIKKLNDKVDSIIKSEVDEDKKKVLKDIKTKYKK